MKTIIKEKVIVGKYDIKTESSHYINQKGRLAESFARHIAIAMTMPDGETKSGHPKWKLLHPKDVATRACDLAEWMFNEFDKRDWLLIPEKDKDDE